MSNHYHLALETPIPNLSDGMHRLQSTFATRFNRFRDERGHLFQGRFHALRIENTSALARVVDYIHLNPVRAKITDPEKVAEYRWSSLRSFITPDRNTGLAAGLVLGKWGLTDTPQGWDDYCARLISLAVDEAEQKRLGFDQLSKGWAIGTDGWKKTLAKELKQTSLVGLAQSDAKAMREARWLDVLTGAISAKGKNLQEIAQLAPYAKGEEWRLEIAANLRSQGVPYAWIAKHLGFSKPNSLKVKLFRFHKIVSM